jgi:hypothetical protein
MPKIIRSRASKSIGDLLEDEWKIVAKRVIAEPTDRTPFAPPRWGIYDYDVERVAKKNASASIHPDSRRQPPVVSFRRMS